MSARLIGLAALLAAGCAPEAQSTASTGPAPTAQDWAAACPADAGWDDPGPPFRIHANSFYVGTCGITAILVTGADGHVLIDGGTEAGGPLIAANIEALGFALSDVRLLLHSHEHFDHVAGLAELKRRTGARLLASPAAVPVMASGVVAADDPQAGMHDPFPAAPANGQVVPGEAVRLGPLALTPVATPGHTPGALTWHWQSCDGEDCRAIVYADSLSPISADAYRFSDHPAYVDAFRAGLAELAALDCDILVTPHPPASQLHQRAASGRLTDPTACADYAAGITRRLDARLQQEATP